MEDHEKVKTLDKICYYVPKQKNTELYPPVVLLNNQEDLPKIFNNAFSKSIKDTENNDYYGAIQSLDILKIETS